MPRPHFNLGQSKQCQDLCCQLPSSCKRRARSSPIGQFPISNPTTPGSAALGGQPVGQDPPLLAVAGTPRRGRHGQPGRWHNGTALGGRTRPVENPAATGPNVDTKRLPSKSEWTPYTEAAWKDNLPLTVASIESECMRFPRSMNVSKISGAIGRLGLR